MALTVLKFSEGGVPVEKNHETFSNRPETASLQNLRRNRYLPPGILDCSLEELRGATCFNGHRTAMWHGLVSFLAWSALGRSFSYAYLGGGFISGSSDPKDIDLVLETTCSYGSEFFAAIEPFFGMGMDELERVFGVHLHFWTRNAPVGFMDHRSFFQYRRPNTSRNFDRSRGIVRLCLTGEKVLTEIGRQIHSRGSKNTDMSPRLVPDVDLGDQTTHRLIAVVHLLSQAESLDSIIEIVRTAARNLLNADGATFVLREGDKCHYVDEDAISPLWKGQKFAMSTCISGWVMENRKVASVPDIHQDNRIPLAAYLPTFVRSLIMAPIRSDDPIGAIGIYWAERRVASAFEMNVLQALANSTSVAIRNVQLRAQLQKKAREQKRQSDAANRELETFSRSVNSDLRRILEPLRIQGTNPKKASAADEG